jgi:hypothetical protein
MASLMHSQNYTNWQYGHQEQTNTQGLKFGLMLAAPLAFALFWSQ